MRNWVTGKGGYNAICDVCGFKFKNFQLHKRWDGLMVCKEDYEPRHILDFYKTRNDEHPLPWSRPEPTEIFVGPSNFAIANVAMAGAAIAGKSS